ncbi:MAG TPA: MFS transporter [Burkholderiales bacterium]|nr:MFS transporter [Burkholderiales bacterium]
MSVVELRAGFSLAGVFGLRMLGLFLILPVFAVHARHLSGGENLTLVGVALGAYGLAQAFLQIPFGMASDRWGRKPLIVAGLLLFAAGSLLAASAHDIWVAIAGRALQGAGAISAVVMALAADLTREQHRVKIMAMVGASIGLSFALSLVAAPALYHAIGMSGLFVLTGALALAAIGVVLWLVPPAGPKAPVPAEGRGALRLALLDPQLMRLNLGIFALHATQMAMFVVVPPLLVASGLPLADHWKVYLPVVLASFVLMVVPVWYADRRNAGRGVMLGAVALLMVAEGGFGFAGARLAPLALLLLAFFAAFNVLEALIPSLVSRIAPAHARGTAIGVYNTTQTLGLFVGGLAGGWIAGRFGPAAVFGACAVLALGWLALAVGLRPVNRIAAESFTMGTVKGR